MQEVDGSTSIDTTNSYDLKRSRASLVPKRTTNSINMRTWRVSRTFSAGNTRHSDGNVPPQMTERQKAEIQLDGILHDPEVSLPIFVRRSSEQIFDDNLSIEQVAKSLNTPEFIVQHLVNFIYPSANNIDTKILTRIQIQKLTRILNGSLDIRAFLFFILLDHDDNNYITVEGLKRFYEKYLKALKIYDDDRLQEIIPILLEKFHLDKKEKIDYEEYFSIISRDSTLLESLSQFTVDPEWFVQPTTSSAKEPNQLQRFFLNIFQPKETKKQRKHLFTAYYIKNNLARVIFLNIYLLINFALTIYVIIYRTTVTKSNAFVVFARIGGMLLNFNCALTIVLMLKRTILIIRTNRYLRKLIPVDDHIDFHRTVGRIIVGLSCLHTIAHMANFATLKEYSWVEYMFTTRPNIGWVGGFASLSGVILCIILAVIIICSMAWVRRGGHFQIFYWTHLLYVPFFVFLIVHATNFWKWIIGPLTILLIEKFYSTLTSYSTRSGRTFIHCATIEQSNVIKLTIHRPKHFTFKPGDYISLNLPRVALYEFHPFTISSAPENTKYITVHILAVGNWTRRVYQHFEQMLNAPMSDMNVKVYRATEDSREITVDMNENDEQHQSDIDDSDLETESKQTITRQSRIHPMKSEPIIISGPYSSCARYVFDSKHVVLVAGGIGITPYASVLSSLMAHFRLTRVVCRKCQTVNYNARGLAEYRHLKKVDFIWVNRDQKSFEWFLNLLQQFEEEQEQYLASNAEEERFLNSHLYFTEVKLEENIGNAPLDFITKICSRQNKRDMFTCAKSKAHIGRPKWDELFHNFVTGENASASKHISVFFCGPPTMGTTVKEYCKKYKFRYHEEKF